MPLGAVLVLLGLPAGAQGATTFVVTNTNDSGAGSLRQAIAGANLAAGADGIEFDIPGTGVKIIKPLTALPNIDEPVDILGYTQEGARRNTARHGTNARLRIVLSGANLTSGIDPGLRILAPDSLIEGLVINRFRGPQIELGSGASSTWIRGSFFGVNARGTDPAAAGGVSNDGIDVESSDNLIGGQARAHRNLISGNNGDGVEIDSGGSGTVVRRNLIGTGRGGTGDVGNGANGVLVDGSSSNTVGGGNVISGNEGHGVHLAGTSNTLRGNRIGTDATGRRGVGNREGGVIAVGNDLVVGGLTAAHRNVISGNGGDGVQLEHTGGPEGVSVQGNFVGTVANGRKALANAGDGVQPLSGSNLAIGGTVSRPGRAPGNVISGNRGNGVHVGTGLAGVSIDGNLIGTNAGGTAAVPNRRNGLAARAGTNSVLVGYIGRNVFSGNRAAGVLLTGGAINHIILNARIGTNRAGTKAVPNRVGVEISKGANSHQIGETGRGNLISGNRGAGIWMHGATNANLLAANVVGLAANGEDRLPNRSGIVVSGAGPANWLGIPNETPNTISGNLEAGIVLRGPESAHPSDTRIGPNRIGMSVSGKRRPNGGAGILLERATSTIVGGSAEMANTIAFNKGAGVAVEAGPGNVVRMNSIYRNAGLGIDLARQGATPNDPQDPDGGANRRQNFPVLTSATFEGGVTTVEGRLDSVPSTQFTIDVYRTATRKAVDSEGRVFLGWMTATTGLDGVATFTFAGNQRWQGQWLRATATRDTTGDTSELGPARRAP